jgi:hypothetical protein
MTGGEGLPEKAANPSNQHSAFSTQAFNPNYRVRGISPVRVLQRLVLFGYQRCGSSVTYSG